MDDLLTKVFDLVVTSLNHFTQLDTLHTWSSACCVEQLECTYVSQIACAFTITFRQQPLQSHASLQGEVNALQMLTILGGAVITSSDQIEA